MWNESGNVMSRIRWTSFRASFIERDSEMVRLEDTGMYVDCILRCARTEEAIGTSRKEDGPV